jgi:signal transduction histidine kinase
MKWPGWVRAAFVAVVAVLFVSAQVQAWAGPSDTAGGHPVEAMLAAGCTLPLLLLHRWPLPAFLAVAASGFGAYALDSSLGQPWFALLLGLYGLGNRTGNASATIGAGAVAAGTLWIDLPRLRDGADISEVVPGWFIMAGIFGFGRWMRHRAEEQRALRTRTARLETEHEAAVAAVVAEEQARIARELHDLVAHALAVIVVQAQAGVRVVGTDPDQAREALSAIESVGREGLVELRRLLDVLDPVAGDADASRPGLSQLEELAGRVRGAGVPVDVVVTGMPRSLPPGLDLSVYRIVQEALTNTIKHAGPARSRVAVHYLPEALEVEVTDDGRTRAATNRRVGRGLIGMRERAALYGGSLLAEHTPLGGFRVRASFPLEVS